MESKYTIQVKPNVLAGFTDASAYDKYRPSYPASAVEHLLKAAKVTGESGARVK